MNNETNFALPKKNLAMIGVGFVIIVIGFLMMVGSGTGTPEGGDFNPEIFSFRRITVAPMIVLFGFVFEIFAIAWIEKPERGETK